ncbi:MAG: transposase family protein [Microcoleaceae cyanobacterium]
MVQQHFRERPSEYKQQEKYYSAKKQNHTFKNQIITTPKASASYIRRFTANVRSTQDRKRNSRCNSRRKRSSK